MELNEIQLFIFEKEAEIRKIQNEIDKKTIEFMQSISMGREWWDCDGFRFKIIGYVIEPKPLFLTINSAGYIGEVYLEDLIGQVKKCKLCGSESYVKELKEAGILVCQECIDKDQEMTRGILEKETEDTKNE